LLLAPPFLGAEIGTSSASPPKLSFAMSARGLPLDFFGAAAFLAFGGVSSRSDSSSLTGSASMSMSEFSSSETALAFFLGAAFALGFAAAPAGRPRGFAGPAAFLVAAALGFAAALVAFAGFAGGAKSELAPSSNTESSIMESSAMAVMVSRRTKERN